jgi:hypothetical protein
MNGMSIEEIRDCSDNFSSHLDKSWCFGQVWELQIFLSSGKYSNNGKNLFRVQRLLTNKDPTVQSAS